MCWFFCFFFVVVAYTTILQHRRNDTMLLKLWVQLLIYLKLSLFSVGFINIWNISAQILRNFPNCGYRRMQGNLRSRGLHVQWMRMKDSVKRVCPEGILTQVLQLSAVQRRTYLCKSSLVPLAYRWNHKLIRYIFKILNVM